MKETLNTMVDQLRAFASEVTRVAREVGSGGNLVAICARCCWYLEGQILNQMTGNLTSQVRNIAEVNKAVASGDNKESNHRR